MRRRAFFILIICFVFILFGCSGEDKSDREQIQFDSEDRSIADDNVDQMNGQETGYEGEAEEDGAYADEMEESIEKYDVSQLERKIIYTAYLEIVVENYEQAFDDISRYATNYGGYVVESSMSTTTKEEKRGQLTVRIPQEKFQTFLKQVENASSQVKTSTVQGEDVTEEYIDLESRLKSKRVVEDRLLTFMKNAEKTEDLLAISRDLAEVQEEIESIIGRMNYLENRSDLATVTINIMEENITISTDRNTWEETKMQFKKSVNFLLKTFSTLIIFVVGNLPVLIVIGIFGGIIYFFGKKWVKKQ